MGEESVRDKTIWDITLPATHNSASHKLDTKQARLAHPFWTLMKPMVQKFCACQEESIYRQLSLGIRFLDLRVLKHPGRDFTPFCGHGGICTVSLDEVLSEVYTFLNENTSEVVLVSVHIDVNTSGLGGEVRKSKPPPQKQSPQSESSSETEPHKDDDDEEEEEDEDNSAIVGQLASFVVQNSFLTNTKKSTLQKPRREIPMDPSLPHLPHLTSQLIVPHLTHLTSQIIPPHHLSWLTTFHHHNYLLMQ
eukprot:GHVN01091637.1.p1 GENE.GHVN01091637.1~~GHVN01091637.1.p1  ORF type:complete len:249 (-),score=55.57 GHVN01091637.1:34-780(-)